MLKSKYALALWSVLLLVMSSCTDEPTPTNTQVATIETGAGEAAPIPQLPPTWTSVPDFSQNMTPAPTRVPPPSSTPLPTALPLLPTDTPNPTETPMPSPTAVPTEPPPPATATETAVAASPTPIPLPTEPPAPVLGPNLLPNPSFEEGWFNQSGIAELQVPNGWIFEWDEGPTGFGSNPWDVYVRPETRVLSPADLPVQEHPLFIFDGIYTVKIFKGYGAVSYRLVTDVALEPGSYVFKVHIFPDLYSDYANNQKIWAPDPYSGEFRFVVTGADTGWTLPTFGVRNTFQHTFTLTEAKTIRLGIGVRGRFAIMNNGWFMDDWSLRKVGTP